MSEHDLKALLERATDPFMWAWCWIAFRLVMVLPIQWPLCSWLLPFAGYYAYHDPEFHSWRWSERIRDIAQETSRG